MNCIASSAFSGDIDGGGEKGNGAVTLSFVSSVNLETDIERSILITT